MELVGGGERKGKEICACTYGRLDWKECHCLFLKQREKMFSFTKSESKTFLDMNPTCVQPALINVKNGDLIDLVCLSIFIYVK